MKDRATMTFHSTAREAAQVAKEAGVGKLIIGHFSARYKQLDPLLEEAREVFPNTDLAIEGSCFKLD
jgi:ribonuclease Z